MYRVDMVNSGDYSFMVKSKDSEFVVDIKGKGMTPPDALLASLGSCIGVYLRKYAEGAKLDLAGFTISAEADFSQKRPVCFRKINVEIDLKGAQFDERRIKSMREFIENCPVHLTLKNNPEVEIKIK
ncbi:MAG: OsmC family protein [Candidatus Omnitrophota bacterium]